MREPGRPMLGLFSAVRGWIAAEQQPFLPPQQLGGASQGSRHELLNYSRLHAQYFFGSCSSNCLEPCALFPAGEHSCARADRCRPMEDVGDQGIDRAQLVPTHVHARNLIRARTLNSRNTASLNLTSDANASAYCTSLVTARVCESPFLAESSPSPSAST